MATFYASRSTRVYPFSSRAERDAWVLAHDASKITAKTAHKILGHHGAALSEIYTSPDDGSIGAYFTGVVEDGLASYHLTFDL